MPAERQEVAAAAWPPRTIAIVGAGQAGGWAAQTLRAQGYEGQIVLIGEERHPPHERPPLSKSVLSGEIGHESTRLQKSEAFEALGVDWRPGERVRRIDRSARSLDLAGGSTVYYDKLILCTGGRARRLAVPGAQSVAVHTLRTIDDAVTLAPRLVPGTRLVVIGGGWIGLEVAATASRRGLEVTVVEAQSRLCERALPPEMSDYLAALHHSHGTRILVGTAIERLSAAADESIVVDLTGGQTLTCDTLVAGIGMLPNDELARDAGLVCEDGIVVDTQCRTSDADIFAAGDVAVTPVSWAGRRMRLESWQNAQEQGIAAARSALGLPVDYQPLPWFWSDQYGVNLQIYGIPGHTHRVVRRGAVGSDSFVLFYLDGDVVHAAIGPNAAKDLRFARRLIEQRRPVDVERLVDTGVPLSKI